jgi:hypothetical protein
VLKVIRVPRVYKVLQALLEHKAIKARLVLQDQLVHKVIKVQPARWAQRDLSVPLVTLDQLEPPDLVLLVLLGREAIQEVLLVLLALGVSQEPLV